jgi:hypothetical protein
VRTEYVRGAPGSEIEIEYAGEGGSITLFLWSPQKWSRTGSRLTALRFKEVVVAVEATGVYNTREGKEAVVRGLKRR